VSCDFANSHLHGYFDGELSDPNAAEFERHLQHCVHCAVELVDLELLSGQLQVARLYEAAPASFRKKIRTNLRPVVSPPALAPFLLLSRRWLAVAALLLAAFVVWRVIPAFHSEEDYQAQFAMGIVDAYLRSLPPGQITNVNSNDPKTLSAWFERKIKFTFPVRDFTDQGFSLQGGRVDVVQGRTVATLVYASRKHLVNVFAWPARDPDATARAGSRQGYQWIDWRKDKMEFCAVSDAPTSDLQQLQDLLTELTKNEPRKGMPE
jgi:anti-sigma factor RsiW